MSYENLLVGFVVGPGEIVVALVVGLLIFGNRLPEVGKSLGKGLVEFKKGLRGIEDQIDKASDDSGNESKRS